MLRDLTTVTAFVTVAEVGHFGRAAEQLHLTQPALSKRIRRLERELGVKLLDRSRTPVALTAAGRTFLPEAQVLLARAEAAVRVVRATVGEQRVTLGFMGGIDAAAVVAAFGASHPEVEVVLRRLEPHTQTAWLLDGTVDVALGRLPVEEDCVEVVELFTEQLAAVLHGGHPLGGAEEASILDLADEPVVRHVGQSETWNAIWAVDPRPDGRRAVPGPVVHGVEEKLEQVAAGRAIALLPVSVAAAYQRRGLCCVPLVDAPPTKVALMWRAGAASPLREALLETAQRTLGCSDAEPDLAVRPLA